MLVAIDGPAGVGKSTIARRCAQRAGFLYINSGSFYRAVALAVLDRELGGPCLQDRARGRRSMA